MIFKGNTMKSIHKQAGMSLIETMIALAMSLIVTSSMIVLIGNSMGSATRIIEMSQLTDELRNAMSMMSRDVRRANYNSNNIYCYANSDCGESGGPAVQSSDILDSAGDVLAADTSCFVFGLDRNYDGNANNDGGGGFRRRIDDTSGNGMIEMWVGTTVPVCGSTSAEWVAVTDPDFVDITGFRVSGEDTFENTLEQESGTLTQRVRYVEMEINGQLTMDNTIRRTIRDKVNVRNHFFL
jgi:prepilin peptidase dependent protein B